MKHGVIERSLLIIPLLLSANVYAANSDTGSWSAVIDMPIIPVAVANLPNGNVLTWAAKDRNAFGGVTGRTYTAIFDPYNGTSTEALISYTNHDMFCPGINNLPDGRILVAGGSGNEKTSIYDPATGAWATGDPMNTVRGYQGNVTLTDGSLLTLGGSWSDQAGNKNAERWTLEAGWIPYPAIKSIDTVRDGSPDPAGEFRDDNHAWLWAAPNGKVFHAGPSSNMHWVDFAGDGTVTAAGTRGNDPYSMNGTTVMYDAGKILKTGGAQAYDGLPGQYPATKSSYTIDINNDTAVVQQVQDMAYSRAFHNSVVLPSGEVFVSGGMTAPIGFSDEDAVLVGEIWNPSTQAWTQTAAMVKPRTYHSVSILLNDGRVLVGGGGLCAGCAVNHPDVEIFSPPYLYVNGTDTLATRPVITQAPDTAAYNSNITVQTNSAVTAFALVRANSATHSVNNEQRRVPVTFTRISATNYQVNMPSRNVAPPGNYMLFALNAAGTPSVSQTIKVGSADVAPTLANGLYEIESPTSAQRLGAPEWNNFQARMVGAGDWTDQHWDIEHLGGLVYTVQNVATQKYLEVNNAFCGTEGFDYIVGSDTSASKNQRWIITQGASGNYSFRPQHCKTKGLDREQDLLNASAIVWDYAPNHAPQLWKLNALSTTPVVEPPTGDGVVMPDGEYWLESPIQGQRLTLPEWSNFIPRMVDSAEWSDQKWIVKHLGDGVHTIQNTYHQQYLQVTGSFCADGLGSISGSATSASANQQWRIYQSGTNYTLKPAHCLTKSLDREGGFVNANAIVWNSEDNHVPQLWKLASTSNSVVVEPGAIADGRYWIESPSFGQRLLAPEWNNFDARMVGTGVWDDQKWDITHLGGGEYTIKNVYSNKYLQVANSFCGTGLGAINGGDTGTADNQKWLITTSGSSYNFRPVHCPTKGLDREEGLVNANAIVWDFIANHGPQLWNVVLAN
ncbi:RICIN domain-containing protein [Leucothrix arctica]|uniref:Ricin B lectin domain-containing protein n=1 Tax=Leucothrix arctica TaxID=1481894 RepID=A0A317CAQ6_9GAMM|nr:RICIN domain-containing protein [Leucothrix arctica]PWQ95704.1 hypothetical protein DKT75_11765 [Leucothrix arctica]